MRPLPFFVIPALLALLLTGCANTSHVVTGKPREPIDPSQVTVYTTAPPKYEEIAVIDASSQMSFAFGDQKKMDAVMERLKKEAASLGANGVLLQGTGSQGAGGVSTGVGVGGVSGGGGGGVGVGTGISISSPAKTGRGLAIHVPGS
jgi:hypothetical protein